jgi:hypothetical protein
MSVEIFQHIAVIYGAFALVTVLIWRAARDQTRERHHCPQEHVSRKAHGIPLDDC